MTAVHVLVLLLGALMALVVLGSALKTVVLPQRGNPRLAQFVFALVYRILVAAAPQRPAAPARCAGCTHRSPWSASRWSG